MDNLDQINLKLKLAVAETQAKIAAAKTKDQAHSSLFYKPQRETDAVVIAHAANRVGEVQPPTARVDNADERTAPT